MDFKRPRDDRLTSSNAPNPIVEYYIEPATPNVVQLIGITVMVRRQRQPFCRPKLRPSNESQTGMQAMVLPKILTPRLILEHCCTKSV